MITSGELTPGYSRGEEVDTRPSYSPKRSKRMGRTVGAVVCAIALSGTASCVSQQPVPSKITIEGPASFTTPAPLPKPGTRLQVLMCEGFADDGIRVIEHPIIQKKDAQKRHPLPMMTTINKESLELAPSNEGLYLTWYDRNGDELETSRKPNCYDVDVQVTRVKTTLPNPSSAKKPQELLQLVLFSAIQSPTIDVTGHIYNLQPGAHDRRTHDDLVHVQHFPTDPSTVEKVQHDFSTFS